MLELRTKLDVLENIVKSDNVMANEKVCILSNILPEEIKIIF